MWYSIGYVWQLQPSRKRGLLVLQDDILFVCNSYESRNWVLHIAAWVICISISPICPPGPCRTKRMIKLIGIPKQGLQDKSSFMTEEESKLEKFWLASFGLEFQLQYGEGLGLSFSLLNLRSWGMPLWWYCRTPKHSDDWLFSGLTEIFSTRHSLKLKFMSLNINLSWSLSRTWVQILWAESPSQPRKSAVSCHPYGEVHCHPFA